MVKANVDFLARISGSKKPFIVTTIINVNRPDCVEVKYGKEM